jgi:hypothetical protein
MLGLSDTATSSFGLISHVQYTLQSTIFDTGKLANGGIIKNLGVLVELHIEK